MDGIKLFLIYKTIVKRLLELILFNAKDFKLMLIVDLLGFISMILIKIKTRYQLITNFLCEFNHTKFDDSSF